MRLFCSQLLQVSAFAQPLFPPLPSLPPPSKLVEANQGGAAAVAAYALESHGKKRKQQNKYLKTAKKADVTFMHPKRPEALETEQGF